MSFSHELGRAANGTLILQAEPHHGRHPTPDILPHRLLTPDPSAYCYPLPRHHLPARPTLSPLVCTSHHPTGLYATPVGDVLPPGRPRLPCELDLFAVLQDGLPRTRYQPACRPPRRRKRDFCLCRVLSGRCQGTRYRHLKHSLRYLGRAQDLHSIPSIRWLDVSR